MSIFQEVVDKSSTGSMQPLSGQCCLLSGGASARVGLFGGAGKEDPRSEMTEALDSATGRQQGHATMQRMALAVANG